MAGTVWLIADRPEAVIQPGQPPAQHAAWPIPIPDGQTGEQAAADFATAAGFPVGTVASILDLTTTPLTILTFRLDSAWTEIA